MKRLIISGQFQLKCVWTGLHDDVVFSPDIGLDISNDMCMFEMYLNSILGLKSFGVFVLYAVLKHTFTFRDCSFRNDFSFLI